MTQILKVLNDERQPQGSVMLEQQWQLAKSYDWLCLEQKTGCTARRSYTFISTWCGDLFIGNRVARINCDRQTVSSS